jgi:DNA-binding Lrp family transcriptional regulator
MMDNIDLQNNERIYRDSRQPVRKIGGHLDISYNAVDKRIKRMKEQQIIENLLQLLITRFLAIKKYIY